jgi:type VI secretion system protein
MALKLRVISDHYKALGKRSSRLFGVTGGRIGRAQNNDWVLPDPDRYISSHHCKVNFQAGQWVLEDTSTNGVFINGSDTAASVDGPYTLQDGDRLRLGDYEVLVSIDERNDFPPDASGQMPVPQRARTAAKSAPADDLGEELDITDLLSDPLVKPGHEPAVTAAPASFKLEPQPAKRVVVQSASKPGRNGFASLLESLDNVDIDDEPVVPVVARKAEEPAQRKVEDAAQRKADDWQMQTRPYDLKTMSPLNSPAALARLETDRSRRDVPTLVDASTNGLDAFCRGVGIDPASLPTEAQNALLTLAGQMVREVVLGLMEALKTRADMKNKLRLSQTTIQPSDNNPLKFSASVDEAVRKLLDPHGSRYLTPIEAIRQSFTDLRNHQTALASAMQGAMDEFMSRIEPGELQERFDRGLKRGALLGAANKMKYWDLYAEFYQVLNQRNEQGLPTLFGEEFARTYAEKVAPKKK